MAKFFVGQLVRVKCEFSCFNGVETVVTRLEAEAWDEACGYYIGTEVDLADADGVTAVYEYHELEPILYDGAQPIAESFEEMMGKLREGVVT